MSEHDDYDHTPHTHGGTDAAECTPYGITCHIISPAETNEAQR